jgi:hypothetical protein
LTRQGNPRHAQAGRMGQNPVLRYSRSKAVS